VSICLIDTSILCEILQVPNKCGNHREVYAQMEQKIKVKKERLLLPVSAILETGNHIGQNGDGRQRRATAENFVVLIQQAIRGETPFTTTPFLNREDLEEWLAELPDWAMRTDDKGKGSGLADLTIVKEWARQCALNPGWRVYIWSTDGHLSSYDRRP
jgi:hypothetical protein